MAMDSNVSGVTNDYEKQTQSAKVADTAKKAADTSKKMAEVEKKPAEQKSEQDIESIVALMNGGKEKEPSQSTIDSAISSANTKMSMLKTHCAYAYDKDTKRITIKVFDDETDELIREVPPEKSLEALKKIWELAGIFVDEKR